MSLTILKIKKIREVITGKPSQQPEILPLNNV